MAGMDKRPLLLKIIGFAVLSYAAVQPSSGQEARQLSSGLDDEDRNSCLPDG
jgi:hypothetical protein